MQLYKQYVVDKKLKFMPPVLELFNEVEESVNVVIVPKSAIQEEEKEGSSLLGMIRSGGINWLNPYLTRDLID